MPFDSDLQKCGIPCGTACSNEGARRSRVSTELPQERATEAKIRDLLKHADAGRKQLMLRVLREVAGWEG